MPKNKNGQLVNLKFLFEGSPKTLTTGICYYVVTLVMMN